VGDVRSGSKADLTAPKSDFRFTPENGLKSDITPCPKSATTGLMHCNMIGANRKTANAAVSPKSN
jgi:hypothetical protein